MRPSVLPDQAAAAHPWRMSHQTLGQGSQIPAYLLFLCPALFILMVLH